MKIHDLNLAYLKQTYIFRNMNTKCIAFLCLRDISGFPQDFKNLHGEGER